MNELKNPPLPQNLKVVYYVVAGLFVVTIILGITMWDVAEKTGEAEKTKKEIENLESKGSAAFDEEQQEDEEQAEHEVKNKHFAKQIANRKKGGTQESEYLQNRKIGTYYLLPPVLIAMILFLYWVYKKHRNWIK